MASRQFFVDMAAATALSSQAKRDAAVSKAWAAEAARMTDPVPGPMPTPTPVPTGRVRPFSDSSPFNTPIKATRYTPWGELQTHANNGGSQHFFLTTSGYAVITGVSTDPVWTLKCPQWGDAPSVPTYNRNRSAQTFTVHAPADLGPRVQAGDAGDQSMFLMNGTTYFETWKTVVDTAAKTITCTGWATGDLVTSPGGGTLGGLNDGTRAANTSWFAGLISKADVAAVKAQVAAGIQPRIEHALAVAGTQTWITDKWIPPATAPEKHTATGLPLGTRFTVKPDVPMPVGMSPLGQAVWYAVQTYGIFLLDSAGGEWPILYSEPGIDPADLNATFIFWDAGGCDFDRLVPYLMIAS